MNSIPIELSLFFGGTGFLNGIFLSIYFYLKKGHIAANKYLALLLLAVSIKIGYAFVFPITGIYSGFQFAYWKIAIAAYLSIGPLTYSYLLKGLCIDNNNKHNVLLYFIPAFIILFLPENIIDNPIRFGLCQTQYLTYVAFASYKLFIDYQNKKNDKNKTYEKVLKWNRNLLIALLIIWLSVLTKYLIELAALYSFLIYVFIFLVIERNKLFNQTIKKYEQSEDFKTNLLLFMKEYKPYLNPELSLATLAEEVHIHKNQLSKVINEQLGLKFSDFINSYRINEAVEKLSDTELEKYTIASIAYDCGFNNLSTFNLAFKKEFKMTPRQYQKLLK